MEPISKKQLTVILEKHKLWLNCESGGERANLANADLSKANLSNADLSNTDLFNADLFNADLCQANLSNANLSNADLANANLFKANLANANLSNANLSNADLYKADLAKADLSNADLANANLCNANLSNADLSNTDLSKANLANANLCNANLSNADLSNTTMTPFKIVPEIGPFYAFKKLKSGAIATLYVPASAQRVNSLIGRKCRVSKAKVIAISKDLNQDVDTHTGSLVYKVGKWVKPDKFDDDIRIECTNGIHCFITRKEAEDY